MNEIVTDRLRLKPFTKEDMESYANVMGEYDVGRWFPIGRGYTRNESEKSLDLILKHWKKHGFGIWAVTEREGTTLLGRCGLNNVVRTSEVEVDFAFSKAFWGRGYGTEAARAALKQGFQKLNLPGVVGLTKPDNVASRRVIEKIGMRYIGNTQYWGIECAYYAISRNECFSGATRELWKSSTCEYL